ncbi:MAG TPA: hypothetical protein H9761_13180 [Candidatus Eisenbergiella merdavium]|uniref:SGNH hydrolase-type esterase domain-containing protein n=1 Tax=Candidatus Eisenbergiella merdavium TaxID=2838551 RepID=A0A9D2NGY0_9FIRM|nr:hypothetical protein [Candidatus Eisenbergiella merdavium]
MNDTRSGRRYILMAAAVAVWMLYLLPLSVHAQEALPEAGTVALMEEGAGEYAEEDAGEGMEEQPAAEEAAAEVPEDIIFVGDSRFVQMENAVGENPYRWIAKVSQGYDWFVAEAVPQIDDAVQSGTKILINFGVNDVANEEAYAELVNRKAAEWNEKGARVYYSSVNPVENGRYVTEEKVEKFNESLEADLDSEVEWIDSFSWLVQDGYTLTDGLHFSRETYERLYAFYLDELSQD